MMRFGIALFLCLCMLASFAHADYPTRTIADSGWFAIGGPGHEPDTLCGTPCFDFAFANFYGPMVSNALQSYQIVLHDTRGKAINALINGEFSINSEVCQPADSGLSGALVSGFVRFYTLNDFTYDRLLQASPGLPGLDRRINEITQAIHTQLNNLGLANLADLSPGALINPVDGQPAEPFNYEAAFIDLNLQEYAAIARWAKGNDAVVFGYKVSSLQTSNLTCP